MPTSGLLRTNATFYLICVCVVRAPKSREVYNALKKAEQSVRDHKGALPSVPLHLRNAPTKLMRDLGMYIQLWYVLCVNDILIQTVV